MIFVLRSRLDRLLLVILLALSVTRLSWSDEAELGKARAAIAKGDVVTARAAARQVLITNPGSAEAEAILGLADTAEAQLGTAAQHFEKSVALQPANFRAHTYLGSTYLRLQRLPEARKAFLKVLVLQPGNEVAQYNLGVIAMLEKKPSDALPYFSAVHKSNPRDAAALLALLRVSCN